MISQRYNMGRIDPYSLSMYEIIGGY